MSDFKDMAEAMKAMQPEPQPHRHRFTVPVEWETWPGRIIGGLRAPDKSKVKKLKCESCPAIEKVSL